MSTIATLLLAAGVAAASPARFEGTVRDAAGAPVANATVSVEAGGRPEALGDTAASVLVLSSSDLKTTAGIGLDDALRQVPGFSLFRRTPSRGANPTTQGANFRGLGGSGASRAGTPISTSNSSSSASRLAAASTTGSMPP